jgi:pimeloyl-ACP methyl ester carboxylesterase
MRAGFELYRAFDRDAEDNRNALRTNGKLTIPVLALGGEISTTGPLMGEMAREIADDVTARILPGTAHWLPEESPEAFVDAVIAFTAPGSSRAARGSRASAGAS